MQPQEHSVLDKVSFCGLLNFFAFKWIDPLRIKRYFKKFPDHWAGFLLMAGVLENKNVLYVY